MATPRSALKSHTTSENVTSPPPPPPPIARKVTFAEQRSVKKGDEVVQEPHRLEAAYREQALYDRTSYRYIPGDHVDSDAQPDSSSYVFTHSPDQRWKCLLCETVEFTRFSNLQDHMETDHSRDK